jgi:hypothetical protein
MSTPAQKRLRLVSVFAVSLAACADEAVDPVNNTDAAPGDVSDAGGDSGNPGDATGTDGVDDTIGDNPDTELRPDAADVSADPDVDVDVAPPGIDPGFKAIHRLNRAEYNNTVRDLFLTTQRPADDFPADDISLGFDNIAETLTISPLHIDLALRAAELLVNEAILIPLAPRTRQPFEAELLTATSGGSSGGGWNLWSNGQVYTTVRVDYDGRYVMTAVAEQDEAGADPAQMVFRVDGADRATFAVPNGRGRPGVFTAELDLTAGEHEIAVAFTNDFYQEEPRADRNLVVDSFEVDGPVDLVIGENTIREAIFTCSPAEADAWRACARQILEGFVPRAWRRPPTDEEYERLELLIERALAIDTTFDAAVGVAMQAALVSPAFLYRVEGDLADGGTTPHALNAYEIASRLSYFLWSSMPDAELFELAASDALLDPTVIEAQVERMLADPRAEALIENFAGQWLFIRNVANAAPDPWLYPNFDDALRESMQREMEIFFGTFVFNDRNMLEMLTADSTFVDGRLAAHYGIEGVEGDEFVEVTGTGRGGLLRQAGLLTALSYPGRTSPVRRGKFILGQLLCSEPEPPPADAGGLQEGDELAGLSLRERMEMHRRDPSCAACHSTMDPLGFGLEHYDALGAWRDFYGEDPIDATGVLPDGSSFDGAEELAEVIAANDGYARCIADKLFTYALGRPVKPEDAATIHSITQQFGEGGYRFSELATAIATSEAFRMRRGEGAE